MRHKIISIVKEAKLLRSCDATSIQKSDLCAAKFILYSSSDVSYVCVGVCVLQRCWCTSGAPAQVLAATESHRLS